ncbi:MAG: hypothetical protein QOH57_1755 [Mycobacterium sp.]|jgi:anti-anti-sigma factor|nr:hypothetical protein [Pseudonocardiales bacterium]MDT5010138.1 hypothetical protein [Mycobacterium sp.]
MTAVNNTTPPSRPLSGRLTVTGATFSAYVEAGATVITAAGELDATNTHDLVGFAGLYLADNRPIVLDLSALDFFAAQGVALLTEFDGECSRHGVDWAVVSGRSVARPLQICDRSAQLPSVTSINAALEHFSRHVPEQASLQLVTETG